MGKKLIRTHKEQARRGGSLWPPVKGAHRGAPLRC